VALTVFCLQGLHPRIITEGFDKARVKTLEVLEKLRIKIEPTRESLLDVARTSLRTKIHQQLADMLTDVNDTILMFIVAYSKKYSCFCFMAFVILSNIKVKHSVTQRVLGSVLREIWVQISVCTY
jgi:hypothetical protein